MAGWKLGEILPRKIYKRMTDQGVTDISRPTTSSSSTVRQDPLTDRRFEDLLQQASAFFAKAERDPEAEKQVAIAEIIETMKRYGLTVEDLRAAE